jgi:hypothetical protein
MQYLSRPTVFHEVTINADSPQEESAQDDARVTQLVDIVPGAWENRRQAAIDFLGHADLVTDAPSAVTPGKKVNYISRITPMPYVDVPKLGSRPLYCVSIPHGQGVGAATKHPLYNTANFSRYRMTLTFRPLPFKALEDAAVIARDEGSPPTVPPNPLLGYPDEGEAVEQGRPRYISRSLDFGGQLRTIRGSIMRYVDDTIISNRGVVPEPIALPDPFVPATYRWFAVPFEAVPHEAIMKQLNTVNNATFDGFAPETMLFLGAKVVPRAGPINEKLADVTYAFKVRYNIDTVTGLPTGWNTILRTLFIPIINKTVMNYIRVSSDGTSSGTPPFRSSNFRALFQPTQPV